MKTSIDKQIKSAITIQNELSKFIKLKDVNIDDIKTVAGVDSAYWTEEDGTEMAVCCIVVIDVSTKKVIEKQHEVGEITFPYVAGCLAFRELELALKTIHKIETDVDLFIFDGNGILHERKMGIASHAGVILDKPTIGIAKKLYNLEGLQAQTPDNKEGEYTFLVRGSEILGASLRTHKDAKPIYVSVGNNINLGTSIDIALKLTTKDSRIPIPTRLADIETHIIRKEHITIPNVC